MVPIVLMVLIAVSPATLHCHPSLRLPLPRDSPRLRSRERVYVRCAVCVWMLLTGLTQVGEFKDDDDVIAKHLQQSEGDGGDCVVRDLPEGRQIVM